MVRPQTCKRCGRVQNVVWRVSDELWNQVCKRCNWDPRKTLCLECFADLVGYVDLIRFGNLDAGVFTRKLWKELMDRKPAPLKIVDEAVIKKKIDELKIKIIQLENCLKNKFNIEFIVIYHNKDTFLGQYYPEDDYDISYTFKYCDNWKEKLVVVDKMLQLISNSGYFQAFLITVEDIPIKTIEKKKEFDEILQIKDREEIITFIKEFHKISENISDVKSKINICKHSLSSQEVLKEEFQDKEIIRKIKEKMKVLDKKLDALIRRKTEIKNELKCKFGIDISEIRKNIKECKNWRKTNER